MKIIHKPATHIADAVTSTDQRTVAATGRYVWKILIVDDEPDIRTLTRISLRDFEFHGRTLEFIEAESANAAKTALQQHPDIAVALVDVVMESSDAGLQLVEFIRQEMKNLMIRIVIRTGQPGVAPERYVIDHYDIDDYKDKTELTSDRLYTTVRSALKAFRDLQTIDTNRQGLERVLRVTPEVYQLGHAPLSDFFNGILTQIIGLCGLSHATHIGSLNGMVATIDHDQLKVQAYTDHFVSHPRFNEIQQQCIDIVLRGSEKTYLRNQAEVLPLAIAGQVVGYIYIEPMEVLSETDRNLIYIFAKQCSQALENHQLHSNIVASFEHAVDMLAEIAEYKDKATGGHVNRLDSYTQAIAVTMGVPLDEAQHYGKASRLHDVGKVGIPDHILTKPGKLTAEEFEIIKTHTTLGANILGHDQAFSLARDIALNHHERWDGKGYPSGIKSSALPLATRIVSVADVFDAMISWRPYKQPWPLERVREAIADGAGSQFDPEVVKAFLHVLDNHGFDELIKTASQGFY